MTREAMREAGHSPSVRLFEAGACGTPILSDWWHGLDSIFEIDKEVLVIANREDTLRCLRDIGEQRRLSIGEAARKRVLTEHTPAHRAAQLESYWKEWHDNNPVGSPRR